MEDRLAWFALVRPLIGRVEFIATAAEPKVASAATCASGCGHAGSPSIADITAGRILLFGDRGNDVQAVQRALARLGYDLQVTGN
jgi:peptidoglycan hydrolase-like protein with peptidoglycan-binding domain